MLGHASPFICALEGFVFLFYFSMLIGMSILLLEIFGTGYSTAAVAAYVAIAVFFFSFFLFQLSCQLMVFIQWEKFACIDKMGIHFYQQ